MNNDEIIDLTKMDREEICHIKCHQRKLLVEENKKMQKRLEDIGDFINEHDMSEALREWDNCN